MSRLSEGNPSIHAEMYKCIKGDTVLPAQSMGTFLKGVGVWEEGHLKKGYSRRGHFLPP